MPTVLANQSQACGHCLDQEYVLSGTRRTGRGEDVKASQQPPNTKFTLNLYRNILSTPTPLTLIWKPLVVLAEVPQEQLQFPTWRAWLPPSLF